MSDGPEHLTPRALERRVKRWLLSAPFECFVQVAPGLEPLLARELADLGLVPDAAAVRPERGGVTLALDLEGIMAANLGLRTASRVLLRLGSFPAAAAEMLHDRARKLPWELHLGFAASYALRVSSRRSKLQAGDEASRAVTGAVARRMGALGLRPRPAPDAELEFAVRLEHDRCTVSFNTSGEHLHRRGLRRLVGEAPARETLAAAVALLGLAEQLRPDVVVDPFCGSGAVLIEVADALAGLAPGRARSFAFEHAGWFRPGRWREVRRRLGVLPAGEAADAGDPGAASERGPGPRPATPTVPVVTPAPHLLGIDADARVLEAARANLAAAGHAGAMLHAADSLAFDLGSLGARQGLIVSNLPYGVRLGDAGKAAALTRRFLSRLGEGATRWRFALLTNDARRVADHPDVREARVTETVSGGLTVYVVTGSVGGRA
ncbi:MAG TPA: hypothetical protein VF158_09765 [Longimicrobiales bacterium]